MSSVVINLHMLTGPALSPPKIVFTKKGSVTAVGSYGGGAEKQGAARKNYGIENLSEPRRSLRYRTPIGGIL
jgi:hypothetical protein